MSQSLLTNQNELEIIEFIIEEEMEDGTTYSGHFGINVAKVVEIIRLPVITSMPNTRHPSSLGTFNLRGRILPLVNLGTWLGKKFVNDPSNKVLVTEFSGVQSAFLVTAVNSIHRLTWDRIEPVDRYVQVYSHWSVTGVLRIEDRVLFILDMEKILGSLDHNLDMTKVSVDTTPIEGAENFHVLVVDDSHAVRKTMVNTLEAAGFQVTELNTGKEAWTYLQELRESTSAEGGNLYDYIHLVISDIEMPEMDGHSLTVRIRTDPIMKNLPVILFSSLITESTKIKGEKAGADRQVSKPDLACLNQIVREVIQEKLQR